MESVVVISSGRLSGKQVQCSDDYPFTFSMFLDTLELIASLQTRFGDWRYNMQEMITQQQSVISDTDW